MLVWFPEGWEYFAKWGKKEELEVGQLIINKWPEIKDAARYTNKHKDESKEIRLGVGPGNREYSVDVFYTGSSGIQQDFLQQIGFAPIMKVGMDILALTPDLDKETRHALVGHVYDDHNDNVLRIVGTNEIQGIKKQMGEVFDEIV